MKIERDKADYPFPTFDETKYARVLTPSGWQHLIRIWPDELRERRKHPTSGSVLGVPVLFAIDKDTATLMLWPGPSEDGELRVMYAPPLCEV